MSTYTQITRNEDGEYIRETKQLPTNTVYLVEYATKATYYKVENCLLYTSDAADE